MSVLTDNAPQTEAQTPKAPTRKQAEKWLKDYADLAAHKAEVQAEAKKKAEQYDEQLTKLEAKLMGYADAHRSELPAGRKSLDLDGGRLGWKTTPGRVVYADTSELEKVLDYLEAEVPRAVKRAVETSVLRQAWDAVPVVRDELAKLGVAVLRSEEFYVKPAQD